MQLSKNAAIAHRKNTERELAIRINVLNASETRDRELIVAARNDFVPLPVPPMNVKWERTVRDVKEALKKSNN